MPASSVKIFGTVIPSGAANDRHPDMDILSLAAEVARHCSELDTLDESNDLPGSEHHPNGEASMLGARTAEIAADLDRLEKKLATSRAITIEGLKAKAAAADALRRFGYESIQDSIISDLISQR